MREEKRKEMNRSKEMRKKRKEKKSILMCMFGNRERRGKEKRRIYFFFLCLVCNKKEIEKKIYGFLLLCSYKCKKCIKVREFASVRLKFSVYFSIRAHFFLYYKSILQKHPYQFIY